MKRKLFFAFLILFLSSDITACAKTKEVSESQIFAMDTVMNLTVYGSNAEKALKAAAEKIYTLENQLSVTKESSEVSMLNAAGGDFFQVSETVLEQLKTALEVSNRSGGAYDITVLPIVKLWGFGTEKAHVPSSAEINTLKQKVDFKKIEVADSKVKLYEGAQMTLASITKGYAAQSLINLFRERGIKSAVVNLGGNVQALGTKPDGSRWRVGIQDPKNTSAFVGVLETADMAVVTSGGYQRYFDEDGKRYHHILDPRTGYPAENGLLSVTIVCDKGALADALSTALFVLGKDKAIEYWRTYGGFEAIFITDDGQVAATQGLKESFSLSGSAYKLALISKSGGKS